MKTKGLLIVGIVTLAWVASANAGGPDLSAYGTLVDRAPPMHEAKTASGHWPTHVCAEIQRVEASIASGFGPESRGISRIGLLTLEGRHCGIDVSKKMDADQAAMLDAHRASQRGLDDIMDAAQRAASSAPREQIIVNVPQAAPEPAPALPAPPVNCLTTHLGGGMSATNCR